MTKKDVEKMVEYHNSTLTNTVAHRPLRLGLMHARRIYALAYYVTQLQAQGKLFRLEDWSMEKADKLLQHIALEEDAKSMDPPTLGKIGKRSVCVPLASQAFSERMAASRMSGIGIVLIPWLHSQSKVLNTPDAVWLRAFESKHDGCGAIMKIPEVHEGEGEDAIS
eukprot:CCRYP_010326-RA/>CCRYP_010326-RA protein AED:0.45 eAED:1.00 QI:0/0/0/1/1/1/2/0/165